MTDFVDWRSFDYQQATVQLWVFKKSATDARFRAWHVRTDEKIETLFRQTIIESSAKTTEEISYSPISQNNESSCLTHSLAESEGLIALLGVVDAPEAENTDAQLKQRAYESTLSEKKIYQKNFEDLAVDPAFNAIFSDIQPLKEYVGTNAIQLRRITVIQTKALYLRPDFPQKLQEVNLSRNFGLNFDDNGKLIVCANTAKTVMQVLLDHRLLSEITEIIYDVPDADVV